MAIQSPQDLFVWFLSDVRKREERSTQLLQEMSQAAQDPDIKEILDSRIFLRDKITSTLDHCFQIIGKQPVQTSERLHDVMVEDFRRELGTIQSPLGKSLYVAAKLREVMHLHIGEYTTLVAMADVSGHYSVGSLLEVCLADNLALAERTSRVVRRIIEAQISGGMQRTV